MESVGDFIHKEKNQKKDNKTNGQVDKVIRVAHKTTYAKSKMQPDKVLTREANYMKNNHIDDLLSKLLESSLISKKYKAFYASAIHQLGVGKVSALMFTSLDKGHNPAGLFHFLINKELNAKQDKYSPRL